MKMRKVIAAFLAAICMLSALDICVPVLSATHTDTVYAETETSLRQGDYGYCYVYLDDLTDLASINVAVYYDTEKVTVLDSYNQVACSLYDFSNQNGCLQYSYIFSGEGESQKTNLFFFCYQIGEDAAVGESYFDIVITDAHNNALESLPIGGSRCGFTITEGQIIKTGTIYGTSNVYTAVKEEFTLSYSISNVEVASGALAISYDPELFEFVELTPGGLLNNKVVDINSSLPGTVYISFVGTEYNYDSSLLQIRFRTIKNVDTAAQIQLSASDLCDLNLQNIQCSGYTTMVDIVSDPSYTEDAPSMRLAATFNEETNRVTVVVTLDADSHLGAGDFALKFDTTCMTYASVRKGFAPNFFNINDKNVADGELKFSIISLSDITAAQTVLTIEFDAIDVMEAKQAVFEITGSGLSDAFTNPITLNFVNANVLIPATSVRGDADGDGDVSAEDLTLLARHVAGIEVLTDATALANVDVNGDNEIDANDLTMLARYVAVIITDWT